LTTQKRLRGPGYGCRNCKTALTEKNWSIGLRRHRRYWCNQCYTERQRHYAANDPHRNKKVVERRHKRQKLWSDERREHERILNRNRGLRKRYGLSSSDYEGLMKKQGEKCAVCFGALKESRGRGANQVHVDHCHETGIIRGLLCGDCNRMIGMSHERAWVLHRAADYICLMREDPIISIPVKMNVGRPTIASYLDHKLEVRKNGGKKY